ncbi:hypothetical protein pb186bvf_002934 [Paramecium bursaria]
MELFISDNQVSYFLELLSDLTNLTHTGRVKPIRISKQAQKLNQSGKLKIPIPSLITEEGDILTVPYAIAQYLTEVSYTENVLLNGNIGENQLIQVFEAHERGHDLIEYFSKTLEGRVFLVGKNLTISDLFLYSLTLHKVSNFTDEQKKGQNVHFFRWQYKYMIVRFKLIQSQPQVKAFNDRQGIQLVKPPSPFVVVQAQTGKKKK